MAREFDVVASCSCHVCGGVYNILGLSGVCKDDGLCMMCSLENGDALGDVAEQVSADLESYSDGTAWESMTDNALLPHILEWRDCPTCGRDFPVAIHVKPGRVRVYCNDVCAANDRKRRERWRKSRF